MLPIQEIDQLTTTNHLVSINTASFPELDNLPGIGQTTLLKIISNRSYSDVNELVSKKILTKKVFDNIKDMISL